MLRKFLIGTALAGTGDIVFAIFFATLRGSNPERLLQIVASGALGKAAFDGGMATALVGLGCHFALSALWMLLFMWGVRRWPALLARPLITSLGYGLLVFVVMRLGVLPLSALPFPVRFNAFAWGMDLLSHVFLFALPMVLVMKDPGPARLRAA